MGHDYTSIVLYGTLFKYGEVPAEFIKKIEDEYMSAQNPALGWTSVPNQGRILYLSSTYVSMDRHDHKHIRQINVTCDVENQFVAELNKYPPLFVRLQQLSAVPYWYMIYN
jgi:hypothetical protein